MFPSCLSNSSTFSPNPNKGQSVVFGLQGLQNYRKHAICQMKRSALPGGSLEHTAVHRQSLNRPFLLPQLGRLAYFDMKLR